MTINTQKIIELCIKRIKHGSDFTDFSNALVDLGVFRQTYDVLENSLYFYSQNSMICKVPMSEITKSKEEPRSAIGNKLDKEKLKKAIARVDENKLSIDGFHQELSRAGVVYVSVFLIAKVINYLGQDSEYFIETY